MIRRLFYFLATLHTWRFRAVDLRSSRGAGFNSHPPDAVVISYQRTQHSIVVRPTAVRAILTDIICQTIVQHCRASDLELTITCCI